MNKFGGIFIVFVGFLIALRGWAECLNQLLTGKPYYRVMTFWTLVFAAGDVLITLGVHYT